MNLSEIGLNLIKHFEGCQLKAYLDQAGIPTIGYGHIKRVKMGDTCTLEQAEQWLKEDVAESEASVNRLVTVPINQFQFDALVSFVFNLGTGNFFKSTLRKLLNKKDYIGCANEFPKWRFAGSVISNGLVKRRQAEKDLFLKGLV
ncbi:MAG: lysozyme [Pseudomonadota bacterium]